MPTAVTTFIDVVLSSVVNQIIATGLFAPPACFLSLTPDIFDYSCTGPVCIVTPGRQTKVAAYETGAGNALLYYEGTAKITLWYRLSLDSGPRSNVYLADAVQGIYGLVKCLVANLNEYAITDHNGNTLMPVPFRNIDIGEPQQMRIPEGWGQLATLWEVAWQADVNCP